MLRSRYLSISLYTTFIIYKRLKSICQLKSFCLINEVLFVCFDRVGRHAGSILNFSCLRPGIGISSRSSCRTCVYLRIRNHELLLRPLLLIQLHKALYLPFFIPYLPVSSALRTLASGNINAFSHLLIPSTHIK